LLNQALIKPERSLNFFGVRDTGEPAQKSALDSLETRLPRAAIANEAATSLNADHRSNLDDRAGDPRRPPA